MRKILSLFLFAGLWQLGLSQNDTTTDVSFLSERTFLEPRNTSWTCTSAVDCTTPSETQAMTLEQIEYYLTYLNQTHPDKFCLINMTEITGEQTCEGRDILMAKVKCQDNCAVKKVIWIDAGMRGCDHKPVALLINMIPYFMLESNLTRIGVEFNIVVVANPDGYEYARSTKRTWKKNRCPTGGNCCSCRNCFGVDITRNFDNNWANDTGDEPNNPCSDDYKGEEAASEVETRTIVRALDDTVNENNSVLLSYLSLRSAAVKSVVYSYCHTNDSADTESFLQAIVDSMVTVLNENSETSYEYGQCGHILGNRAGAPLDWAYDNLNRSETIFRQFQKYTRAGLPLAYSLMKIGGAKMNSFLATTSPDECKEESFSTRNNAVSDVGEITYDNETHYLVEDIDGVKRLVRWNEPPDNSSSLIDSSGPTIFLLVSLAVAITSLYL